MTKLNFWGVCGADIASTLHMTSNFDGGQSSFGINIFTPQGELFTELEVSTSEHNACSIDLGNLMAEILPESGLRHGLLAVNADRGASVVLRLSGPHTTIVSEDVKRVSIADPVFFPKVFSRSINSYLALVNTTEEPVDVIVRLVALNRAPEKIYQVDPFSTKLVCVEVDFEEINQLSFKQKISSYIRVRCKSDSALAVSFFEHYILESGSRYTMIG